MTYSLINDRKRRQRIREAKQKGTHTRDEWQDMKYFFEHTCCCCMGDNGLANVEKEHIIPVYLGGSDSIRNIQPLCAKCNLSKGGNISDWRPQLAIFLNKELPEIYKHPY